MTIRKKTLLIVAITTICLITILYIVSRVVILDNFADLERKDTIQNVERALNTLSDDIKKLESTATDWAAWDDTWVFVQDVNPDYIEDNLQDSTLTNLGLNVMVFINSSGQIVHSKAVDLEAEEEVPAPRGLTEHIPSSGLLTSHADTESIVAGIILLPEGPMIVVSHPILTNEEEGPIAGAMIIGRFLNSGEINRLAEVARLSLSVYRLDDPNIPSDFETALTFLSADDDVFVKPIAGGTVAGYSSIKDIYGTPILLLRTDTPREIYEYGLASNSYLLISLSVVGLALIMLTLLLLEKLILSRLTHLSKSVEDIGKGGNISARVVVTGKDELSNLGNNINNMLSALEQSINEQKRMEQQLLLTGRLAAVGELAAGVAHELNNPLAAVQAYSQLLNDRGDLDERTKEDIATIYKEAQRASRITSNLLSFARQHKPERSLISINETLKRSLELQTYHMKVNNIEVVTELDPDLPRTMADFYQIQQVFVNLVTNSQQAMTEAHGRGKLVVKTQKSGKTIQVTFTDNGPGIQEENLKRMFDPFFTTKDVGKGTGLGLSICYGIVQEHGGNMYSRNNSGEGVTFVVEMPIVSEQQLAVV